MSTVTQQLEPEVLKSRIERFRQVQNEIVTQVRRVIVGQEEVLEQVMIGLFVGGHCLITGLPGTAKTLLVRTMAQTLGLVFKRIQFTPDLMPSDITGTDIIEEDPTTGRRTWTFVQGPIFGNILLADEINRTPPKTQSALLEAMQERMCTVRGNQYTLPAPFFVLATQNPLEQAGTYPLPEAQLDRFLLHVRVDYPDEAEERDILTQTTGTRSASVPRVMSGHEITDLQALVRHIHLGDDLLAWITRLVRATRPGENAPAEIRQWVKWGAGPRAGQSLVLAAKARALLHGRLAATREDIAALAAPVMRHRLLLSFAAEAELKTTDDVVASLLRSVPFTG
jgi:MoxR-like ATPase